MSDDPKRKIEELLEASAKARRAQFGDDAKMPGPMRSQLHDEIGRSLREREKETRTSWFAAWWPRLATGAAVALLLAGGPLWWSTHKHGEAPQLAANKREAPLSAPVPAAISNGMTTMNGSALTLSGSNTFGVKSLTAALSNSGTSLQADSALGASNTPNDEPAALTADGAIAMDKQYPKLAEMPVKIAPAKAPQPMGLTANVEQEKATDALIVGSSATRNTDESGKLALQKFADVSAAPSAPIQAPAATAGMGGGYDARQQSAQSSLRQEFRMIAKLKQSVNVLQSFQIEQNASRIRIIDADGSTYTGELIALKLPAPAESQSKQSFQASARERLDSFAIQKDSKALGAEFHFRATGSNLSLKKPMVFEGSYIASGFDPSAKSEQARMKKSVAAQTQQQPARIVGVAKINGQPAVEVDAVSVEP